ncbi:hypothetical protein Dsin_028128 [Dipteronia sinensis]|uniref:RING-type domain-containing protein n=1 Tax=Dipteronia sinensis TaxID=43782 RepID=A0AAD9ZQ86_9ROSI|nr:hypothetical protein Dsin_028128 [Dipteronia sinensis]
MRMAAHQQLCVCKCVCSLHQKMMCLVYIVYIITVYDTINPHLNESTMEVSASSATDSRVEISGSGLFQAPLTTLLRYSTTTSDDDDYDHHQDELSIRIVENNDDHDHQGVGEVGLSGPASSSSSPSSSSSSSSSSYQRYDVQLWTGWLEQILPFSLFLLLVFIRQHFQGFLVTVWVAAVMFKSNDILQQQTALKGERKVYVLVGVSTVLILQLMSFYWWYRGKELLYPLILLPPKQIPPFSHAIFVIAVNDTMVRQAAMVLKCMLLMYYKNNSRGYNFRKQGQMLNVFEYSLLLYRGLLPTPVWYRFFLNKEYGRFFSSLITGLYLTVKLTVILEKVQLFLAALKALSGKEMHYGAYATSEQVNAAGDLCAICQEKIHAPVLLRCKHIFCEDCVSEWFERERTCPLCRALVKPAGIRSYSDGSTSLYFQLF